MRFIARFRLRRLYAERRRLALTLDDLRRRHAAREHVNERLRAVTRACLWWEMRA